MGSSAVFLVFFVVGCLPSVVTPLSESTNFPRDTNQYGSLVRHNNNQEEEEKDQELLLANNNNNNRRRRDQSLPISVGRAAFADTCSATLLGPAVTGDTFISQDEFASFVADYCVAQGVCNANLRLTFADLPRPVQSVFTNPQCESPSCSRDASSSDVVVGYLYTPATQETVIPLIQQMCFNAYPLVVDFVAPTPGAFCVCVCVCVCVYVSLTLSFVCRPPPRYFPHSPLPPLVCCCCCLRSSVNGTAGSSNTARVRVADGL